MAEYRAPYLSAHQTRLHEPTDWEYSLADAVENAFSKGHHALPALVAALNASRVRPREGGQWTEQNFSALMAELGA